MIFRQLLEGNLKRKNENVDELPIPRCLKMAISDHISERLEKRLDIEIENMSTVLFQYLFDERVETKKNCINGLPIPQYMKKAVFEKIEVMEKKFYDEIDGKNYDDITQEEIDFILMMSEN